MGETRPEDIFNILVATDIHLGYAEKDPIRGEDSFNTFEEILRLGEKKDVDFILLGGDLFHDSKPSPLCLHKCLALLRKYCMGDKPISVEFLSDQSENFKHCVNKIVNYEDPNLNISIPVYSIHGNHDDPSGFGRLSAMDLMSVTGLLNYFGKWTDLNRVDIKPILLKKGQSKLALYGLSHIKDERLARLFRDDLVNVVRPSEETEDWMNIMVLHQNRADRGPNNFIKESMIPKFVDLVIWGHEHESRIDPEWNQEREFYVVQPGSPVATSLCEGESVPKHVGILRVFKKKFKLEPIRLQTVRPLVFDTVILSQSSLKHQADCHKSQKIENYVSELVENMLEKANDLLTGDPRQPTLPLLRLRVEYSASDSIFHGVRFGQRFADRVANPSDLILARREAEKNRAKTKDFLNETAIESAFGDTLNRNVDTRIDIQTVLEKYFTDPDNKDMHMRVLSVVGMAEAVARFIDKDDRDAITDLTAHQMKKTIEYVKGQMVGEDDIVGAIENFRDIRLGRSVDEGVEARNLLSSENRASQKNKDFDDNVMEIGSDSDNDLMASVKRENDFNDTRSTTTTRGRGRGSRGGRARGGTRGSRGTTRARGTKNLSSVTSSPSSMFSNTSLSVTRTSVSSTTGRRAQQTNIADLFKFNTQSQSPSKRRKYDFDSDSD